ncbi:MAG: hydroxymethylbilane synthase [Candidatus Omnitrophota bacterium]|nr:hydroxymethylbilane synthase [Candidatus Omnitrophota bacterium]
MRQVEEFKSLFPVGRFDTVVVDTQGDKDKVTPLSRVEGSDFFTRQIDEALLAGTIDCALHSSKDVPDILPRGLKLLIETRSISPFDALVSCGNYSLVKLPRSSRIGTSSIRRKAQISEIRPDLEVVEIRGTIEERLILLDVRRIDALVVAHAALMRLGLLARCAEVLPLDIFPTHPKQGSLSLITREDICEKVKSILLAQGPATGN